MTHKGCRKTGLLLVCLWVAAACTAGPHRLVRVPSPESLFAAGEQAFAEERYGDAVQAYRAFSQARPQDPRRPVAMLRLGRSLFALQDLSGARAAGEEVLRNDPDSETAGGARLLLARVSYAEGRPGEALALLRRLVRSEGTRDLLARSYLLRGRILVERGELALGLSQWKKGLLVSGEGGDTLPLYREMAEVLDAVVSRKDLERLIQENARGFPADLALFVLGKRERETGDPARAARLSQTLSDLFPGHPLLQEGPKTASRSRAGDRAGGVRLGCIAPLSGRWQEIGRQVLQGVRLSVDRWNTRDPQHPVHLLVRDSTGDPARAGQAMEELARVPHLLAVVGPVISRSVAACAAVAEEARLALITPAATAEGIPEMGNSIFRNAMTNEGQAVTMAHYAVEQRGLHSFVVLYPEDFYGRDLAEIFIEEIAGLGGTVIASVSYPRGTVDFGPQIRAVVDKDIQGVLYRNRDLFRDREAGRREWEENYFPSFDAVYLPGYAEDVGLLAPQLAYYNIESVQLLGSHYWNSPELVRRGERYVEGAVFTDGFFAESDHTDITAFVAAYQAAYGEAPTLFAAQAYDAAEMILQILDAGGHSREEVREGLQRIRNFPGVSGLATASSSGEMQKDLFLIRVEKGTFRQIN